MDKGQLPGVQRLSVRGFMKKKPVIQKFSTPDSVFVNMQNGSDYVRIPLTNLDADEVKELLIDFVKTVAGSAGYGVEEVKIDLVDEEY